MKTYILQNTYGKGGTGHANKIATYQDKQEALKSFHQAYIEEDGEQIGDSEYVNLELLELNEDTGEVETIADKSMYYGYSLRRGYWVESFWNAEQQAEIHNIYFQGEKENDKPMTQEEFENFLKRRGL